MTKQEIQDLLLIGKFMNINYLFPYQSKGDEEPLGLYIAEDEGGWLDYKNGINWYDPDTDYNQLMKVVEKIESLDLKEHFYQWEYDGEKQYNFNGIVVSIEGNHCMIYIELSLDPIYVLTTHNSDTKKQAVYKAVIDFIKWYNDLLNR